jgi:hypothetical protein
MNFKEYYKNILTLITEAEEEDESPEQPTPNNKNVGVEGVDVLGDQESQLVADPIVNKRIISLTNLLLNALRFKPSDEFRAYLKMPMFHNLKPFQKLTTIKNIILKNPERIIKESDEPPADFGDSNMSNLTENDELDLLRLIIRAINVNPYALSITLKELPYKADETNYEEIIETIESVLF